MSNTIFWVFLYIIGQYLAIDKAHSELHQQVGIGMLIMFTSGVGLYNSLPGKRFFSKREGIMMKDVIFSFSLLISFFLSYQINDMRNNYLLSGELGVVEPNEKMELDVCNAQGFCRSVCNISYVVNMVKYEENIPLEYCQAKPSIHYSLSRPDVFTLHKN